MITGILSEIICCEFEKNNLRGQGRKTKNERQAMLIAFRLNPDFIKYDGSGKVSLLIYGHSNYVQVWIKVQWTLIPLDEKAPAPADTDTGWVMKGEHDSCWREPIGNMVFEYRDQFSVLDNNFSNEWAKIVPVPDWHEARYKEERKRRGY